MGVDHGGDGVGGVVKSVDELESQRHQQSEAEQDIGQDRSVMDAREIRGQTGAGIDHADNQNHSECKHPDLPRTLAHFGVKCGNGYWSWRRRGRW